MMPQKYQYHVHTWGGFYNEQYAKLHGFTPGDYVFDSDEAREEYISLLQKTELALTARHLTLRRSEGYDCITRTTCHRIIKYEGKKYYSTYDLGINFPIDTAEYIIEYKWYPGFNDYPLGHDFDYEENSRKIKIVREWITWSGKEVEVTH